MNFPRAFYFRNLPLLWKLLIPFLGLILFLGTFGAFLIVRDLSERAKATLDQELSRRSLDARSVLRDRELYLLESVNFAANLNGVAEGIQAGEAPPVASLLRSVLALKTDLGLMAATNKAGIGLVEFTRAEPDGEPIRGSGGRRWATEPVVERALRASGEKESGLVEFGGRTMLAIAAPVCSATRSCSPVGAAIVAIDVRDLAVVARGGSDTAATAATPERTGVTIFDARGRLLASAGMRAAPPPPAPAGGGFVRRTHDVAGTRLATLYVPLIVQGRPLGSLAVSIPTAPAFSSVRGAAFGLVLVLLAAMAGVVGLGTVLSRSILGQVRPLVETNRTLGRGQLSARAPVLGDDELGELARGVNQMAEQLQASYETMELRVEERTEEVRHLSKERTELFAALSHEFRTPLAVVLGQVEMMLDPRSGKIDKRTAARLRTIGDSAGQVLALVNEILELARAERGRIEVDLDDVVLSDVVKRLRPTIGGLAKAAGLRLAVDVGRDLPSVRADPRRLREIIVNLVDNAAKYTPAGGRIELSAVASNGVVEVSVSDTGVGVPPEAGALIFEPFYRVPGVAAQGGQASTGLGLALTKRLVEAQDGAMHLASRPGKGSTFSFTLPVVRRR